MSLKSNVTTAAWVALIVGSLAWWAHSRSVENTRRTERHVDFKAASAAPRVREFQLPQGQMLVVDVPAAHVSFPDLMETRRCFVWRDANGASSAISCEATPDILTDN